MVVIIPKFSKSYELYDYNLVFIRSLANFCGLDIMAEDYKFNHRTGCCTLVVLFFLLSSSYSLVFYYPSYYRICEICVMYFFALQVKSSFHLFFHYKKINLFHPTQGIVKFYYAFQHRDFYKLMYQRLRRMHYLHRNHHQINSELLFLMEWIHLVSKAMTGIYISAGLCYTLYPFYVNWACNEKVLMISLRVPWINNDSPYCYFSMMSYQVLLFVIGLAGYAASDSAILLFVANTKGFVNIFANDAKELTKLLNSKKRNERVIRNNVRKILVQHQEIIE